MREIKIDTKPLLKKLDMFSRHGVRGKFTGEYKSVFKGTGMEFEGYRMYDSGHDDASKIDWRATLRAGKLLTKVLVEERNLSVFILFDVSNSMLFASTPKLKCEYAAEVVASMGFAVLQANDSLGMAMFKDDIVYTLEPNIGPKQYFLMTKALSNPQFYGGGFDLEKALRFTLEFLERDSLLFIVSDFIGLKGDWKKYLDIATEKFDILAFMVRDPLDNELPKGTGQVVIKDPFSDYDILIDPDTIGSDYAARTKKQREDIFETFKKLEIDSIEMVTNQDFVTPILKFFHKRSMRQNR